MIEGPVMMSQVWDMNGPASKEIGGEYHLLLAGNALHNAADLAGESTRAIFLLPHVPWLRVA